MRVLPTQFVHFCLVDQTSTSTSGGSGRKERVPGGFAIPSIPGLYEGAAVVPWPGFQFIAVCVHGVAMRTLHGMFFTVEEVEQTKP